MSKEQRLIEKILDDEWDPIGIRSEPGTKGEYRDYAVRLQHMVQTGAAIEQLAAVLVEVERDWMGLAPDHERARRVAASIMKAFSV